MATEISALAPTWNDGGTTFHAIKANVTDTASAAGSRLLTLQVGAADRLYVSKDGSLVSAASMTLGASGVLSWSGGTEVVANGDGGLIVRNAADTARLTLDSSGNPTIAGTRYKISDSNGGLEFEASGLYEIYKLGDRVLMEVAGTVGTRFQSNAITIPSNGAYTFSNSTSADATSDVLVYRDAANALALRNSTSAQTFNIYNTYTDASNYERVSMGWSGNVFSIAPGSAGTGSTRTIEYAVGTNTGISYVAGAYGAGLYLAGGTGLGSNSRAAVFNTGIVFRSDGDIRWGSSTNLQGGRDTSLDRESAGVVAVGTGSGDTGGTAKMSALALVEKSADPADPAEGESIIWQSDGTGSGDDGDIMVKITAGATTKTITLIDFSAF